jgi:hypothetical protein
MSRRHQQGGALASPNPLELNAPGMDGVESSATILEIRLALMYWRERHGPNHWRLFHLGDGGQA